MLSLLTGPRSMYASKILQVRLTTRTKGPEEWQEVVTLIVRTTLFRNRVLYVA